MIGEHKEAPYFKLQNQLGETVELDDFKGNYLILYFYPKDKTPGCTIEANDFSAMVGEFEKLGAKVVGVSGDSVKSHCGFVDKYDLKITLLSDPEKKTLKEYNAWKLKKIFGRETMGIVRSTFLIDKEGTILKIWPKVKVKEHAKDVLEALKGFVN